MRYATRSVVEGGDGSAGSSEVKVCGGEVGDVYVAVREGMLACGCVGCGCGGWCGGFGLSMDVSSSAT